MRLASLVLAAAAAFAMPLAASAQEVSEEADFLLWCGSAFYFLGIIVDDEAESESFLAAGTALTDFGAELLIEEGFSEDEIIATIDAYDDRVMVDFEAEDDLPHDAEACLAALDL